MRPWTVDADDIKIAEDFDDGLLHKPPWIDGFLNAGDDKFIVVGTKGFGKTLLLKAKRIRLQRADGVLCIPENALLDKPIGDKIFSKDQLALYAESTEWWTKVWLISIAAAVLKRLDQLRACASTRASPCCSTTAACAASSTTSSTCSTCRAPSCTAAPPTSTTPWCRACARSTRRWPSSSTTSTSTSTSTCAPSAAPATPARCRRTSGTSPQMGLVEVAYQLRRVNHHLKVFAAVRKEAFLRFDEMTSMVQQYRGSAVDTHYTSTACARSSSTTSAARRTATWCCPSWRAPARSRRSSARRRSSTPSPTKPRTPFDYIARHTLHRPRDFMTIGQRLSDLRPAERSAPERFKEAVNLAATEIAAEYLNEIAPYLGNVDLQMRAGAPVVERAAARRGGGDLLHRTTPPPASRTSWSTSSACCFAAGLLGHVDLDHVSGKRVQRFLRPGEQIFQPDGILPDSSHYAVHPVLTGLIARLNPGYVQRIDKVNLIGNGRPWKDATDRQLKSLMVLRADLDGFGALMQRGLDDAVRDAMRRAVERYAARLPARVARRGRRAAAGRRPHPEPDQGGAPHHGGDLRGARQPAHAHRHRRRPGGGARARRGAAGDRGRQRRAGRLAHRAARPPGRDLGDRGDPRRPRRRPTPSSAPNPSPTRRATPSAAPTARSTSASPAPTSTTSG